MHIICELLVYTTTHILQESMSLTSGWGLSPGRKASGGVSRLDDFGMAFRASGTIRAVRLGAYLEGLTPGVDCEGVLQPLTREHFKTLLEARSADREG